MYTYAYTYDAVGNRTQMVDGGTTTYAYDANNKMTAAGNIAYTYDSNGNTVTKTVGGTSTTTYSYDWANQLTGITYPDASTAAFAYGPVGERVSKTESGTTLYYWHDGVRVILEGTFSGATWTQNAQYTVAGDSYYDPLISMRRGGATSYYLYDQIGSTRKLVDSSETATDTYQYEAFGNLESSTGSTTNPYQYVGSLGYHKDATSGLLHMGARYYMAEVGAFISPEPLAVEAHSYVYCGAAPTALVDPSGLVGVPPKNCWNPYQWLTNPRCAGYHLVPRRGTWTEGFAWGWDTGYYDCYARCMGIPLSVKAFEELYLHASGPEWTARTWYHFRDKRFTAWGKYSKVLVPRAVTKITPIARGASAVGSLVLIYESIHCIKKCKKCLHM